MTLLEFAKHYNFHDSSLSDVFFDKERRVAIVKIELSWWQQNAYKDGDPEIVEKTFRFENVSIFDCPNDIPYDQVGVFSANADGNSLKIYVVNDFTDEDFTIRIDANQVLEIRENVLKSLRH